MKNSTIKETDGYASEPDGEGLSRSTRKIAVSIARKTDEERSLELFKSAYSSRLEASLKKRVSHDLDLHSRRLDSLARLLEQRMTCSSVHYSPKKATLIIASNTIFKGSRASNKDIESINDLMDSVSETKMNKKGIIVKLTKIILSSVLSTDFRYEVASLKGQGVVDDDLEKFIQYMLNNLFFSGLPIKVWRDAYAIDFSTNAVFKKIKDSSFYEKLIKHISRLLRDFVKLRKSMDVVSADAGDQAGFITALKDKKYEISRVEEKGVHAEMRSIVEMLKEGIAEETPIGISRLSCAHCGLALTTSRDHYGMRLQTRGQHGQVADWPIPSFIHSDTRILDKFVGKEAAAHFASLSEDRKTRAFEYIGSKKSSSTHEDARHGRYMRADSSDSDVVFGVKAGTETAEELESSSLQDIWVLRELKRVFPSEYKRIRELEVDLTGILSLYRVSSEKLALMGSERVINALKCILKYSDAHKLNDLFYCFGRFYDMSRTFFDELINDTENLVGKYGFEAVLVAHDELAYEHKTELYKHIHDALLIGDEPTHLVEYSEAESDHSESSNSLFLRGHF